MESQESIPSVGSLEKAQSHVVEIKSKLKVKRRFSSYRQNQGGMSSIGLQELLRYLPTLRFAKKNTDIHKKWLPSVQAFKDLIYNDPILRMNWQFGIKRSKNTLDGHTGIEVLDMIDSALKMGLPYCHSQLIGCPISVIFIQFMQNQNGRAFFGNKQVNKKLKLILDDLGKMLESQESLRYLNEQSPSGWFSKQAKQEINYDLYICDPTKPHYGFKNWNSWFIREFKLGVRPVGLGSPNHLKEEDIIVNACESTPLAAPIQPSRNVKLTDDFWFKDDLYSLSDMFGAQPHNKHHLAKHFEGGTVYQAFLSALNYHRWHSPIDGVIQDIYGIGGTYFLDQSQFIDYDTGSPNNSQSFLSAVAARKVIVIKADNPKIGKIAIIFIGMVEISTCVETVKIGDKVVKGQQLGHFAFGGSSHAIIFEKKTKLKFNPTHYEENENGVKTAKQQLVRAFLAQVDNSVIPQEPTQ